ncbi:MAG: T9SS type A sorting domain-containing protein [Flavobacteriales bacterium]|nr:T9SS type A sorting domain-containing protein [Flavobacteriales bacterium]MCB9193209.1 T9SS type A sorting domain-containing protein [Flavobacteriales bacterium]
MRYSTTLLLALLVHTLAAQRLVPYGQGAAGVLVEDLLVFNNELTVGGWFYQLDQVPAYGIAAIDMNGNVTQIGPFVSNSVWVYDMALWGSDLAVAYRDIGIRGVATWDGTSWTQLGPDFDDPPKRVAVFNGELYAAGDFTLCGNVPLSRVAKWDGGAWVQAGTPLDGEVQAMTVHDGDLYIGGLFTNTNGTTLLHVARLSGSTWSSLGAGMNATVEDLRSVGNELWMVGEFTYNGDSAVALPMSARWDGAQFLPLSPTPLSGSDRRILHAPSYGYFLSDAERTLLDPGPGERSLNMRGLRAMAQFNGLTFAGGDLRHYSYREMKDLGKVLPGEDAHILDLAGMRVRVDALGGIGYDLDTDAPGYEVPAGSGASTVFDHGLCAVAVANGALRVVPAGYESQFPDGMTPGPWCADTSDQYWDRYTQVWPMDKGTVWDHNAHWNDPGYVPSYPIAAWPGDGDAGNDEPATLAPYLDANSDGVFDPSSGDIPLFRGDAAVYQVSSDQRTAAWTGLPPMGVDVHAMTYVCNDSPSDTNYQVMYEHYRVVNRSSETYDTLWLASRTDTDIGGSSDDYVGCDTVLNMAFGYNGDAIDETGYAQGYGEHPPAQGLVALNADLHAFAPIGGSVSSDLTNAVTYYNYAIGLHADGSPMVDLLTNAVTHYRYPGDPNDPSQWSEQSAMNAPGDRRFIASYGPWYNVAPGDTICLDLAFVFAQDTLGDNLSSVTLLKQRAAAVRAWYDQHATACNTYIPLAVPDHPSGPAPSITLRPNPTTGPITLGGAVQEVEQVRVRDLLGQVVLARPVTPAQERITLDLGDLASGTYLVELIAPRTQEALRVVVMR